MYYYYVLSKIYLKKGASKMKKFWKMFVLGFFIGFGIVYWVNSTIQNSLENLEIYKDIHNER